ncbi:hypothetical protein M9H77_30103 [Catharanthus roseus]|uniref:Uncharacterized protein n=1 Tax=Catharanthus roseus TaxID=4058 RepID=A0ACB9ZWP5_CATRO|nr:hypothetical protein M9H77_30103 [Catharanthus roseus]
MGAYMEEALRNKLQEFEDIYLNMKDEFHHVQQMQQALKGLEQRLSCLARGVEDLKVVEETLVGTQCLIINGDMVEEFPKNKELSQAKIEESLKIHVEDATSKESGHYECAKEKESELEKNERVKENEFFIEKQESEKEEQREKEIVAFENSEEVNFCANRAHFFFARKYLCVQNFDDSSKDEGGKLAYKFFLVLLLGFKPTVEEEKENLIVIVGCNSKEIQQVVSKLGNYYNFLVLFNGAATSRKNSRSEGTVVFLRTGHEPLNYSYLPLKHVGSKN